MRATRNAILLTFAMQATFDQLAGQGQPGRASEQPMALVSSLYAQVVCRHPLGVTKGADMTTSRPLPE